MNGTAPGDGRPGFVELQLLRHGPPHNQLLSPLTEYLALCGDHPNTTLRIPLEHSALETRLRALRYFDSEQTRVDQLRETARIASELFAKVPGLIAELSSDRAKSVPFVHLSIAARASELALFPFELASAPDGFPGAGQPLCLQKQMPVCVTRRSRNVRNDGFDWDRRVKILMVASDAGGEIPALQHYALLRKLVEPWVGTIPTDGEERKKRKIHKILRLLMQASVDKIAWTLRNEVEKTGAPFTHVHVLAHGCDLPDSDRRSGIAFHHPTRSDQHDAVDGKRLAETLGALPDYPASANRHRGPAVVTLATCGSADQAGVVVPGASLAFELHDSGIPLVVGSQFPLTTEGSTIMTEALYRGFLAGEDPRSTVWEARRALQANLSQSSGHDGSVDRAAHDWASLTVYAALPDDLDDALPNHRRRQKRRRLNVRMENLHRLYDLFYENLLYDDEDSNRDEPIDDFDRPAYFESEVAKAKVEIEAFAEWTRNVDKADIFARVRNGGILASARKQIGLLSLASALDEDYLQAENWAWAGERYLIDARSDYESIFQMERNESWALVQFLALDFTLRADYADACWTTAHELALLEVNADDVNRRTWALTALLELQFLDWLKADFKGRAPTNVAKAEDLARRIRALFSDTRNEVLSAVRQFWRYVVDFAELAYFAKANPGIDREHSRARYEARTAAATAAGAKGSSDYHCIPAGKPGYQAVTEIERIVRQFADIN